MKTTITPEASLNNQTHTLRLRRMKEELSGLLSELHSYRCEPCTPDMHKQFLSLDNKGRILKQTIRTTTDLVKSSSVFSQDIGKEVVGVIEKYHKFQKNLSIYKSEAVVHH